MLYIIYYNLLNCTLTCSFLFAFVLPSANKHIQAIASMKTSCWNYWLPSMLIWYLLSQLKYAPKTVGINTCFFIIELHKYHAICSEYVIHYNNTYVFFSTCSSDKFPTGTLYTLFIKCYKSNLNLCISFIVYSSLMHYAPPWPTLT